MLFENDCTTKQKIKQYKANLFCKILIQADYLIHSLFLWINFQINLLIFLEAKVVYRSTKIQYFRFSYFCFPYQPFILALSPRHLSKIFKQQQLNKVSHTMPPKVDPSQVRFINIKVFGGEAGPAATLAPKLGPLGLNAKKVGQDIVKEGGKWKGIRVMVQLKCQNRAAQITVRPTSSALIIKELGNYERDRKKTKNVTHKGNLTLEQVKKIARTLEEKSLAKNLAGTVKSVLGTCLSVGCTVDKLNAKQVIAKINNGEIKI